ncbi:MAG: DUF2125 domain-containing protein [Brevundimonas sp.]|nr:MAG: DUF2125 domain-containing protein [Brevundimonas sp.]
MGAKETLGTFCTVRTLRTVFFGARMTDAGAKPYRHPRRGIIGPFLLVGIILAAWTGWWFYLVQQVETRLDAQVVALRQDGWTVRHGEVRTTGWPFRASSRPRV